MAKRRTHELRQALLEAAFWRHKSPVVAAAKLFGVSRQAVQRQAIQLVRGGQLIASGATRGTNYRLARLERHRWRVDLNGRGGEDRLWAEFAQPVLESGDKYSLDLLAYGFTEMVNNAFDHSEGTELRIELFRTAISLGLCISDNGVGIFQKVSRAMGLSDPRQALLELGKGKFTTDPAHHTGEGIFFTSRSFDRFSIRSSTLLFRRSERTGDWLLDNEDVDYRGTRIAMHLLSPARRRLEDVFSRFSSGPEEYRFAKTHVPLRLARFGDETLLSRSSAKRVLARVDRFDEVLLDFAGVTSVGPAFADEIFRVFANAHPQVKLIAINANEQVTAMIRRAQAARDEQSGA